MRRINKQAPVASFEQFKKKNPNARWPEDYSSSKSAGYESYKESRIAILVNEQDCLCGYTEISISDEQNCHIDHYRKRDFFPKLTFEWNNLIAASNDEDFGAKYKDGKAKIKAADYSSFFNPVADDVHKYFYYNQRGEIEPSPSLKDQALINKVKKTIEVFNLQDNSLVNRRKAIVAEIKACAELTDDEVLAAFSGRGFTSVLHQELNIT